ncbi:hypothetical protein K435DRAFT_857891 [Dendrothele bispora CBS 962.96]|uniref:AMP-dependent synthetase/ligase domain-containing protein n=1 Tax=Dendrothele bispora (strain CBS 962.96) TaxID=1314807 RepID=A0A4S8M4I1_DENBC|nr:hypothetical protein K435DRAFT_857891 [Dendrothele bispora CBS 962.96]
MELSSQRVFDEMALLGMPLHILHPHKASELFPRFFSNPAQPFVPNPNFEKVPPLSELLANVSLDKKTRPWTIMHSSGSTSAFPKTIYLSEAMMTRYLSWPWYSETDLTGKIFGTWGAPPFHAMGLTTNIGATLTSGVISTFYKPRDTLPPIPPPQSVLAHQENPWSQCYAMTSNK